MPTALEHTRSKINQAYLTNEANLINELLDYLDDYDNDEHI